MLERLILCLIAVRVAQVTARDCGNPGEILNGYYMADATTLGSKTTFYCDQGYRLVGSDYRLCTADGWDGQVPTCEIVECSRPVTPAHAYVERGFGHKYKYQQEVVFRCNEGFEMIGASVIKCSENNIFVPSPPICRLPVNCGDPEEILNGYYEANHNLGSKVIYHCNEGYKLIGNDSRLCTATGWSGEVPTCKKFPPINILKEMIAVVCQVVIKEENMIKAKYQLLESEREILKLKENLLKKMEQYVDENNL
ncbi:C4b-binding protein beta chain-like isoform X2 [Chiloscyllium plagiosum]|uniref:C4b-binding protein beta chain-like isoform X2 n=1 Tax=Chiloscyllium plagiosum TaxID=36176 RepID=UPI001CB7BAED|nr:C4b-binding protein beta chain-like isoform X2 [Chiloscyllium plagiosum]